MAGNRYVGFRETVAGIFFTFYTVFNRMGTTPKYQVVCHPSAKSELENINPQDRTEIEKLIIAVSECKEPTSHVDAKTLRNVDNLFRIRVDKYRVFCDLQKPNLRVLKVTVRSDDTYEKALNQAEERAGDSL